ncbi:FAD/NAD(P)-binding protein [Nesterenkonia salmonea]|uniref:FAD/NAD(P)-binding protein n=1 Tax=Nesterenkonia salmonea TaxID=1804987 RepID=A0A5R9B8A8_9MICC|nr:FAD/NAD(P)-binding protein [Nesterenkonia salmonea]
MESVSNQHEYVIAVVGAGPRGTSFLERLLAHVERCSPGQRRKLRVLVFDPAPHGSGRVWAPQQSPLYLMNTPASFPTAAPSGGTRRSLPASSCSISFLEFCASAGFDDDAASYPTRSQYGTYLAWLNKEASAHLRGRGVSVEHIAEEVTGLVPHNDQYLVETAHAGRTADAVVLAIGHLEADLAAGPAHLAAEAEQHGLHYQGPAIPTTVDYRLFGPGENVLVRGLGLNFFDLMIQVTAGRGGQFRLNQDPAPGQRYTYEPSGKEPHLIAGSRRGTPYRAKTLAPGFVPGGIRLQHLTPQAINTLITNHHQLDFTTHLWPLIEQDVQETYTQYGGSGVFDVIAFAKPFQHQSWASPQEYQHTLIQWLEDDAASSAAGTGSPEKMATNALHAARLEIKKLVAEQSIRQSSLLRDVEGWFEPLVEGLASGPPLQRIEEVAALARAGIVEFLGPEPVYGVDTTQGAFIADSAAVHGARYTAEHMIEAMMPPNRVSQAKSPLVRGMLAQGLATPAVIESGGQAHVHRGFNVTAQPHRLIHADRTAGQIYVLGLQLSSVQWGTAIAAEAGGDTRGSARSLTDADAAAAEITSAAAQGQHLPSVQNAARVQ